VLFSHGPNKAFLVPDSCRATERNSNSISADVTEIYNLFVQALETGRKASLFRSECKLILYSTTMYVYCIYSSLSKSSKQLNFTIFFQIGGFFFSGILNFCDPEF
jgi:hypothetical protein